jgi:hypothetical protein
LFGNLHNQNYGNRGFLWRPVSDVQVGSTIGP